MLVDFDFEITLWYLAAMVTAILLKRNIYSQLKLSTCWHAILDFPYIYLFSGFSHYWVHLTFWKCLYCLIFIYMLDLCCYGWIRVQCYCKASFFCPQYHHFLRAHWILGTVLTLCVLPNLVLTKSCGLLLLL